MIGSFGWRDNVRVTSKVLGVWSARGL